MNFCFSKSHTTYLAGLLVAVGMPAFAGDQPVSSPKAPLETSKYVVELDAKEVQGAAILDNNRLNVDLFAGASYVYDSNTTQLPNGESAHVGVFDFGFDIISGDAGRRGGFYGFNYVGQAFLYENSAQRFGRETTEHQVGAFFGINGGKTRLRADVDYFRNNGNAIGFDGVNRETRRAASNDFDFTLNAVRDLPHGSLEAGAGYILRDFDAGTLLNDQNSYFGDIAWFFQPGFAPKTSLGFGFQVGEDDFDQNFNQTYYTPSVRGRYRLSPKTNLNASVGYEMRDVSGAGSRDTESTVFNGGVSYVPTSKTGFNLSFYRNNRPSFVTTGQDVNNTGVVVRMDNRIGGQFTLGTSVGYENADFTNVSPTLAAPREDDFWRFQTTLSHPVRVTERLTGSASVFYAFNENSSTDAFASFDQHIVGFRFGVLY